MTIGPIFAGFYKKDFSRKELSVFDMNSSFEEIKSKFHDCVPKLRLSFLNMAIFMSPILTMSKFAHAIGYYSFHRMIVVLFLQVSNM